MSPSPSNTLQYPMFCCGGFARVLQFQGGRGADPDQEAPDVVATELQRWAQEEALRRDGAKRQALAYATGACLPARLPAPALAAAAARGTLRMLLLPACQVHAVTCLPCLPAGLSALPAALGPDL